MVAAEELQKKLWERRAAAGDKPHRLAADLAGRASERLRRTEDVLRNIMRQVGWDAARECDRRVSSIDSRRDFGRHDTEDATDRSVCTASVPGREGIPRSGRGVRTRSEPGLKA